MSELIATIDGMSKNVLQGGDGWRVVRGDCLKVLPKLPDKSVDLIFADPPYNLQLENTLYRPNLTRVDAVEDSWDKFPSFAEYDSFCKQWLGECRRILKNDGAIWTIGTYHNIGRLTTIMQDMDFWLQNDVVWHKTNPMPNFRGVRFTNATETLIWAKKSKKGRAVFNHKTMKAENDGKQMTSVWSFPICGGRERLRDAAGKKQHSTQKPEALLRRLILATSHRGDVVLDPFLGSGTTAAVARQLGRIGVGIERERRYVKIAVARIAAVQQEILLDEESPKVAPRVPFVKLIEFGIVKKRAMLYGKDGVTKACVLGDGNIKINGVHNEVGSIHKIGAKATAAPSCNGWHFWLIKDKDGVKVPIDELRTQARKRMR